MINENDFFKLYACCIPVKGAKRSGICDLQRGIFETIPNSLFEILNKYRNFQFKKIINKLGKENSNTIEEFFNWLINKEFGFWCKSKKETLQFTDLNTEWDIPFEISNAIIDIDFQSTIDYREVFNQIKRIGIPHIQIRFFLNCKLEFLISLINILEGSRTKTIDIALPYMNNFQEEDLKIFCRKFLLINSIIFRHICTDCRAYIEDPEDLFSKPLKCGYDPYTATWQDWSTNPLKQKAIAYYNLD